jgi:hypothetical protein
MSVWDWYRRYVWDAVSSGDSQRTLMIDLFQRAESDLSADERLNLLGQSRHIAEGLGETIWMLWVDHWRIEILQWIKRDFKTALEIAVRATMEVRKDHNKSCQFADRLYIGLVEIYLAIDPIGYENSIRETLVYVENKMTIDYESRCMMEFRRACLEIELDNLEATEAAAWRCINACESSFGAGYYHAVALACLCVADFRRGDIKKVWEYAILGEHQSRLNSESVYMSEFIAWQAFSARKLGDDLVAKQLYRRAMTFTHDKEQKPDPMFYEALCAYHLLAGDMDHAMTLRDQQLNETIASGSPYRECMCRLDRVRLLKLMGQPVEDEVAGTEKAAVGLAKPDLFLARLKLI